MDSIWNFIVEFDPESIGVGLGVFIMMMGICISGAAGIYTRYLLRYKSFIKTSAHMWLQMIAIMLSITLVMCFAAEQLFLLCMISFFVCSAVTAYSFWHANPSWDES